MIDLIINPKSFEVLESPTGEYPLTFAEIYFQIGDEFFPEKSWGDFVTILLNNWIDNILFVIANKTQSARCFFMEGSYCFDIKPRGNNLLIHFIENNDCDHEKIVHREEVFVIDFMKMLQKNAALLVRLAKNHPRLCLEFLGVGQA